jgi:23S rRNA pseudouridine1911/1915/1917 synthase
MSFPEIIFENQDLVALLKPSGMLTIPDRHDADLPSLKQWLDKKHGKIYVVHRIDRDTSGLVIFAKNPESHQYLSGLFESREIGKTYFGLVHGRPEPSKGTYDGPIGEHPTIRGKMVIHRKGKHAITHYRVLESLGKFSWVEFRIETGRTHQIRVHTANAGHPLACDPLYGDGQPIFLSHLKSRFKLSKSEDAERPLLSRLALHAGGLVFPWKDGKLVELEAPLTKDLAATLNQLKKWERKR